MFIRTFLLCYRILFQWFQMFYSVYKMFNTPAVLECSTPFFCLAASMLCVRYRAVYFDVLPYYNMFYSLALARTKHYCLLFLTTVYYLSLYYSCARANLIDFYLHYTYLIIFYLILQNYLLFRSTVYYVTSNDSFARVNLINFYLQYTSLILFYNIRFISMEYSILYTIIGLDF